MKESIKFEKLDEIIDLYRGEKNRSQKRALLILKADAEGFRGEEIDRESAEIIINNRAVSTEMLADELKAAGKDKAAELLFKKVESLNNVLHIVFEEDE